MTLAYIKLVGPRSWGGKGWIIMTFRFVTPFLATISVITRARRTATKKGGARLPSILMLPNPTLKKTIQKSFISFTV